MKSVGLLVLLSVCAVRFVTAQTKIDAVPTAKSAPPEPTLPVINYKACPFEGCAFRKWIVIKDSPLYSTWKDPRKTIATLKPSQVVTGITGVHITYEPDRIEILQSIPEFHLEPGDIILRYMYVGEGFADIWFKGQWKREFDGSFITETDGSGCARGCAAKVISQGRKEWWVQLKTSDGVTGWTRSDDQFDCMDSLSGEEKCDALNGLSTSIPNTP